MENSMRYLTKYIAPSLVALGLALTFGLPSVAQAQYDNKAYDGYCYARRDNAKTNGAVIGAVVGGLAGSQISKNERGLGTVGGAVLGGVVGSQIGKSSVKCYNGAYYAYRQGQYYTPPAAPSGYQVLYFRDRPQSGYYDNVYYDAPSTRYSQQDDSGYSTPYNDNSDYQSRPYDPQPNDSRYDNDGPSRPYVDNRYDSGSQYGSSRPDNADEGWRDDQGQWHNGRPRAVGWQDDDGRWHIGQVVAYGWRDRDGGWHEESSSYSSSSYNSPGY
jgi:uncharacterized membrane protein YeaQ/YmgE (transglycosylase-associated protein family)